MEKMSCTVLPTFICLFSLSRDNSQTRIHDGKLYSAGEGDQPHFPGNFAVRHERIELEGCNLMDKYGIILLHTQCHSSTFDIKEVIKEKSCGRQQMKIARINRTNGVISRARLFSPRGGQPRGQSPHNVDITCKRKVTYMSNSKIQLPKLLYMQ